jgi:lysyl-tRNA synthetase class 1
VLQRYDAVMAIMLPSLREERRQTYSPFLPLHPKTGHVMQVPIEERNVEAGTIVWRDPETGERFETPVTGGHVKLQWKPDWAMRWVSLGVDYEMAGKDLIDSVKLSGEIAKAIGGMPPEGFNYELFLDEGGQKISKSKGNGLTIDEWLDYGTPGEPRALHVQQAARGEASLLRRDPAPRGRLSHLPGEVPGPGREDAPRQPGCGISKPATRRSRNWCRPRASNQPGTQISFSMLLNLTAVANSEDPAVLWGFIRRYAPGVSPETHPRLNRLVGHAVKYFQDFVSRRRPTVCRTRWRPLPSGV